MLGYGEWRLVRVHFFCLFVPMLIIFLLNIGDGSGSDEGSADCAGLRDGPSDGMFE